MGVIRRHPYLVICLVCALFLYHPLLAPGLPNTADGMLHLYRSALWRWAWSDGVLLPRWQTILYQGYGYPVLSFNPPLLYAATALLSLLTASILTAFKAVILLACLSYALSMYLWAQDGVGKEGALVAAVAYTFATWRFRELFYQGNYQQFLAWSLYPWVLFFFHRLAWRPSRAYFLAATLSLAAVMLSHTISAMLFLPFVAAYAAVLAAYYRERAWMRLMGAALVAALLVAFFWLPALAETRYTQVHALTQGFYDVAAHVLRPQEILADSPVLDLGAINPAMPYNYGRMLLLLAVIGALAVISPGPGGSRRLHLVVAACGLLAVTFMFLPQSLPVWRSVPFLNLAEFPARYYGVGFICAALLAGGAMLWLQSRPRLLLASMAAAIVGLILAVAVYQFPRAFLAPDVTERGFLVYEKDSEALGTTSADEFLSVWVTQPPRDAVLTPDLSRQALVNAPPGVTATVERVTAQELHLHVEAAATADITDRKSVV